jgi:soluble lytic murein transglycosylase
MIAAYNAGHNKVEQWLAEGYSQDGTTLDEIPYAETEKYVDKVSRAYEQYKKLYEIG